MEIELRLTNHNEIDKAIEANIDCVGIGDEGCIYRIPKDNELRKILEKAIKKNIRPRIVTPRVAHREFEIISHIIRVISEYGEKVDVIVNDIGVLALCNEIETGMGIYFGRQIVRSIFDCPWYDLILKGENESVKNEFSRHGFDHKEKFNLMKRFRVRGIEVNNISEITSSINRIASNEISVGIHLGRSLLAVGRDCITSRHIGLKPEECAGLCGKEFEIEWDGLWLSPTENDVPTKCEHKQRLAGAVVKGNRVLKPGTNSINDAKKASADIVIIEQESDWNKVADKIRQISEEIYSGK